MYIAVSVAALIILPLAAPASIYTNTTHSAPYVTMVPKHSSSTFYSAVRAGPPECPANEAGAPKVVEGLCVVVSTILSIVSLYGGMLTANVLRRGLQEWPGGWGWGWGWLGLG